MLNSIDIKNFLLIDDIHIPFKNAFTVITGETGAGKSIIIQALMLTLGDKLSGKKLIRGNLPKGPNGSQAIITANFDVSNHKTIVEHLATLGIEVEDELILRRNIYEDGKSKAFINDISVGVQTLASLKDYLLEICGQHSSRSLLEKSNHLRLIDEYADHSSELEELSALYADLKTTTLELDALHGKKERSEIEKDFLSTVIKDLESLKTYAGEEDALIEKRKSMLDKFKTTELVSKISQSINNTAIQRHLYGLQKDIERGGDLFNQALASLKNAISEVKEFEAQVEEIASNFPSDSDMEQIENRLFRIRSAARKYNISASEIPNFLESRKIELDEIDNLEYLIKKLQEVKQALGSSYLLLANKISSIRQVVALELKASIEGHLKDLKMEKVQVQINVEDPGKWTAKGVDRITFLVRTNNNLDFGDIAKTASGGELSRIMLAIRLALSEKSVAEIIIFDEIDTGISGSVSSAVGRKLSLLSESSQVIAITHQPQVAAFARNHIHVVKVANDDSTTLHIEILEKEARLDEIARMISGEKITSISLEAAKSLVNEAIAT